METEGELLENIIACRTCGIHYVTPSNYQLKHLFQSPLEHSEIMLIRMELAQWNVEVSENDGFPQHVCNTCIHKFEQVFELRAACINAQNEFRKFYNVSNSNLANIKIKTELPDRDEEEQPICDFIYVDDLSDTEYDGATPFNIPHVPIKEEIIEAATIPQEEAAQKPNNIVESASEMVVSTEALSSQMAQLQTQNDNVTANTVAGVAEDMSVEQVECKLCQHLSASQEEHKQHMHRAHEIRDMECHICGKEFKNSTPSRLKFHMKWHTLNKHVKCTMCGFVCSSKEALMEHKRANHGKINCRICGKGVLAKKMKSHLRRHELLPKFACEYCTEAFATEEEKENHIWQIHANEDNNTSSSTAQNPAEIQENPYTEQQPTQEILCPVDENDDILNYKFLCAHCDERFMEQIDLETHVNEIHRSNHNLVAMEQENLEVSQEEEHRAATELMHHETQTEEDMAEEENNENEHTNITVFQDYDINNDEIQVPANDESSTHLPTQHNQMDNEENDDENRTQIPAEFNSENSSNDSSDEEEQDETDTADTDTENETETQSLVYNENSFACAKCSETFATVEQLRKHYEQHLTTDQSLQAQVTPSKSQFKCNLCGKTFDLKFSLNRHMKKHKTAPI